MYFGPFGPLFWWEVVGYVRKRRHFLARTVYAALILLVLVSTIGPAVARSNAVAFYGVNSRVSMYARFGDFFLNTYCLVQLCVVLLVTPALAGSAVASEHQRGTMVYLAVSDLSNWEIVAGKWAARVLYLALILLTGLPILTFVSFFGGIDFDRLQYQLLLAYALLFSTASLSIAVSVFYTKVRNAITFIYFLMLLLLVTPYITSAMTRSPWLRGSWIGPIDAFVSTCHPLMAFGAIINGTTSSAADLCRAVIWPHLLAGAFLLLCAVSSVRWINVWRMGRAKRTKSKRVRGRRWGSVPIVSDYPMIWKDWYFDSSGGRGTIVLLVQAAAVALCVFSLPIYSAWDARMLLKPRSMYEFVRMLDLMLVGIALLSVASRAASSFFVEKDRGCLSVLLTTNLSKHDVVWAKIIMSLKPLLYTLALLTPLWAFAIYLGAFQPASFVLLTVLAICFGTMIASLGVFQSLRCRSQAVAQASSVLASVLLLAGAYWVILSLLLPPLILLGVSQGMSGIYVRYLFSLSIPALLFYHAHIWSFAGAKMIVVVMAPVLGSLVVAGFVWLTRILAARSIACFEDFQGRTDFGDHRALESFEIHGLAGIHEVARSAAASPSS